VKQWEKLAEAVGHAGSIAPAKRGGMALCAARRLWPPLLEQCNVLVLSHLVPGREAVRVTISTGKPPDARRDAAKSMVAPNEGLAKFPITGGDQATIRSFSSVIRFAA
jgi:hypothetical protein